MTDAPSDSSAVAPPSEEAPLLTNQLRPHSDAVLTVRIIKSFEFRTTKNLILHRVNLEQMTVGELKELAIQEVEKGSGWKPFRSVLKDLDTLKLYTKAHGSKTTNLIINMENEDGMLEDDVVTLESVGMEHETEVSFFNLALYEQFKANPVQKW